MSTKFPCVNGYVLLSSHMGPLLILPTDGGIWKALNIVQSTSEEHIC